MRRRKRPAMHPPKSLNKLNRRCERAALKRLKIQRRQRKVRTLHRKHNRNRIHRIMGDRRRNHYTPERHPLPLHIKNPRQNHQIQKVSHVRKLHEIIQPRRRKSRQPSIQPKKTNVTPSTAPQARQTSASQRRTAPHAAPSVAGPSLSTAEAISQTADSEGRGFSPAVELRKEGALAPEAADFECGCVKLHL